MRVAVLGTGGVGLAMAALLCHEGHEPIVWSPSGGGTRALAEGAPLVASGAISGSFRPRVAQVCADAMDDAQCVVIAVPAYAYRAVMEAAAPHAEVGMPELRGIFSETGLIRARVRVEAAWLKALAQHPGITELKDPPQQDVAALNEIVASFSDADAAEVKQLEREANHDVKAVEYFLKRRLAARGGWAGQIGRAHV